MEFAHFQAEDRKIFIYIKYIFCLITCYIRKYANTHALCALCHLLDAFVSYHFRWQLAQSQSQSLPLLLLDDAAADDDSVHSERCIFRSLLFGHLAALVSNVRKRRKWQRNFLLWRCVGESEEEEAEVEEEACKAFATALIVVAGVVTLLLPLAQFLTAAAASLAASASAVSVSLGLS